jgi:hypothetical protein
MDKQEILEGIKRLARANGGKAPGEKLFKSETGIRQHEWRGRYWVRWGDALREAGFDANKWVEGYDEQYLLGKYVDLIRELGRFPLNSELLMKTNSDPSFPSITPFKRLGRKAVVVEKIKDYCKSNDGCADILAICDGLAETEGSPRVERLSKQATGDGFVYLLKSGRYYKIGRSVSVGQRERQLAIQLPEKAGMIHSIRTDDPVGIEKYWHRRFETKRKNGEWFDLNGADISSFKRRKFM